MCKLERGLTLLIFVPKTRKNAATRRRTEKDCVSGHRCLDPVPTLELIESDLESGSGPTNSTIVLALKKCLSYPLPKKKVNSWFLCMILNTSFKMLFAQLWEEMGIT